MFDTSSIQKHRGTNLGNPHMMNKSPGFRWRIVCHRDTDASILEAFLVTHNQTGSRHSPVAHLARHVIQWTKQTHDTEIKVASILTRSGTSPVAIANTIPTMLCRHS